MAISENVNKDGLYIMVSLGDQYYFPINNEITLNTLTGSIKTHKISQIRKDFE